MNKYQEAYHKVGGYISNSIHASHKDTYRKRCEAGRFLNELEELVEKAAPKKPLEIFEFEFDVHLFGNCPICGEGCNSGMKYCGRCGQALDWEVEKPSND